MGATGDREAERRGAVTQLCAELNKLLQALRTYQEGHPTLERFRGTFRDQLGHCLQEEARLELDLGPLSLDYQGEAVWTADRKDQSITHHLFLEGVQKITFHQGVREPELDDLVRLWHKTITSKLAEDESFTTGFWECDLENVSCLNLDELAIFYGASDEDERWKPVQKVMDEIRTGPVEGIPGGGRGLAAPMAMARLVGIDPEGIVDVEDTALAKKDTDQESGFLRVKGREREAALGAVMEPPHKVAARAVRALAVARASLENEERERIDDYLTQTCAKYAEAGLLREAVTMLEEARKAGSEILEVASRGMSDPRILSVLVQKLDDDGSRELALQLFRGAGPSAPPALLEALATCTTDAARAAVTLELARDLPAPDDMSRSVTRHGAPQLARLVPLAKTPAQRRAIEHAGLSHPDLDLRRETFKLLDRRGVRTHRLLLLPLLDDDDPRIRRSVLTSLVGVREAQAIPAIERYLAKSALSDEERRTYYSALGSIGGAQAAQVLLKAFDGERDPALKAALALALGRAGDPCARATLETQARKIFTSPKVKEACREALRRLDEPRSRGDSVDDSLDEEEEEAAIEIELEVEEAEEDGEETEDDESEEEGEGFDDDDDDTERTRLTGGRPTKAIAYEPTNEDTEDPDTDDSMELPTLQVDDEEDTASHGQPRATDSLDDDEDPDTEESVDTAAARQAAKPVDYDFLHSEPPDLNWEATFRTTVVMRRSTGYLFGSRYEGRLTDAHFYETSSVQVAYRSFLRDKVRQGFLPHLDRTGSLLGEDKPEPLDLKLLLSFWGSTGETVAATTEAPKGEDRDAETAHWLPPHQGGAAMDSGAVMGLPSPPPLAAAQQSTIESEFARIAGTSTTGDPVARVLVVDDRDFNRDLLARILRRGGHQVFVADGGAAGLQRLAEGGIDLVCLDVNMPGMDGYEVAEVIRRQYSRYELPILFVTARDDQSDIIKGLKAGGNDYLTKPVDSAEALARVRTQLMIALALRHTKTSDLAVGRSAILVVDDEEKNRNLLRAVGSPGTELEFAL